MKSLAGLFVASWETTPGSFNDSRTPEHIFLRDPAGDTPPAALCGAAPTARGQRDTLITGMLIRPPWNTRCHRCEARLTPLGYPGPGY